MSQAITNTIDISIKTIKEAPNYNELNKKGADWKGLEAKRLIIVEKGMASGMPSVDLQLEDGDGNTYIAAIAGNIFDGMCGAFQGVKQRTFDAV